MKTKIKSVSLLLVLLCFLAATFLLALPRSGAAAEESDAQTGIVNGDFETGQTDPWTAAEGSSIAISDVRTDGEHGLYFLIGNDGVAKEFYQTVSVKANTRYILSFDIRKSSGTDGEGMDGNFDRLNFGLRDETGAVLEQQGAWGIDGIVNYTFQRREAIFTTGAETSVQVFFSATPFNDAGVGSELGVFFDNVRLQEEAAVRPSANLLANPGFETDLGSEWQKDVQGSGGFFHNSEGTSADWDVYTQRTSGSFALACFIPAADPAGVNTLTQAVAVKPNTTYTFTAKIKRGGKDGEKIRLGFRNEAGDVLKQCEYSGYSPTFRHYEFGCTYTTGADETLVKVFFQLEGFTDGEALAWLDDLYLAEMPAADESANLIENSGFENGVEHWTLAEGVVAGVDENTAFSYGGNNALYVYAGADGASQTVNVEPNTDYVLRFTAARKEYSEGGIGARVTSADGTTELAKEYRYMRDLEGGYRQFSIRFHTGENTSVRVALGLCAEGYEAWGGVFDNVTLMKANDAVALQGSIDKQVFAVGETAQIGSLAFTMQDGTTAAAEDVEFSSSDADVASVNQDGKVTAVSAGPATITAAAGGLQRTFEIYVTPAAFALTDYLSFNGLEYSLSGNTITLKLDEMITVQTLKSKITANDGFTYVIVKDGAPVGNEQSTYVSDSTAIRILSGNNLTIAELAFLPEYPEPEVPQGGGNEQDPPAEDEKGCGSSAAYALPALGVPLLLGTATLLFRRRTDR